jgi:hypothetical protein
VRWEEEEAQRREEAERRRRELDSPLADAADAAD